MGYYQEHRLADQIVVNIVILEVLLAQVSRLCPHNPSEYSQSSFLRMAGATPTFARTNNLMIGASALNDTLGLYGVCVYHRILVSCLNHHFIGLIDELVIWNRALNTSGIHVRQNQ